jgi:arylsulfatase A-like enzyme
LFSSHKFAEEKPAIVDVAPTILQLFGLTPPKHFDGKAWPLASEAGASKTAAVTATA